MVKIKIKKEIDDIKKIKRLREQGLPLHEIAREVDRSIFFVYSRLNEDYMPRRLRK